MEIKAYAKINLTLEVLGRRPDGYHQVLTILQTVDLADELSFEPASQVTVECLQQELSGRDNLAWKAAWALREAVGSRHGARIRLNKRVPVAMGLGGGSSDAGATLVALNRLWGLGLGATELEEIGRPLGADVPFFVRGGTALGQGRGDVLQPLKPIGQRWLVLTCPEFHIQGKTRLLYSLLKEDFYTDGKVTRNLADAINQGRFSGELLFNGFERVAFDAFPGLDRVIEDMNRAGATFVCLTGTGPAVYTTVSGEEEGRRIRKNLIERGLRAYLLRTIGASPSLTVNSGPG